MAKSYRDMTNDELRAAHKRVYHRIYQRALRIAKRDDTDKWFPGQLNDYANEYKSVTGSSPHKEPPSGMNRYELIRGLRELDRMDNQQTSTVKGAKSAQRMRTYQLGEGYKELTAQEQSALWRYIKRATSMSQYDSEEIQALIKMYMSPDTINFSRDSNGILQVDSLTIGGTDVKAGDFDQVAWSDGYTDERLKSKINRAAERHWRRTGNTKLYKQQIIK